MGAVTRSWNCIPDTDIDPLSCLTTTLMFQLRNNIEHVYEYVGATGCTGPGGEFSADLANIAHDHDGINSAITVGQLIDFNTVTTVASTSSTAITNLAVLTVPTPPVSVAPVTYSVFMTATVFIRSLSTTIPAPSVSRGQFRVFINPSASQIVGPSLAEGGVSGVSNVSLHVGGLTAPPVIATQGWVVNTGFPSGSGSVRHISTTWQLFKES